MFGYLMKLPSLCLRMVHLIMKLSQFSRTDVLHFQIGQFGRPVLTNGKYYLFFFLLLILSKVVYLSLFSIFLKNIFVHFLLSGGPFLPSTHIYLFVLSFPPICTFHYLFIHYFVFLSDSFYTLGKI